MPKEPQYVTKKEFDKSLKLFKSEIKKMLKARKEEREEKMKEKKKKKK